MALATYKDLCIDAVDADREAAFWGAVLGLSPVRDGDALWHLDDPAGRALVWLNRVPEPVTVKNRVHLDVNAESLQAVLDAGASVVDDTLPWTLVRDPDGQEVCVFVREAPVTRPLYELVWDTADSRAAALSTATWWAEVLGGRVQQDDDERFSWVEDIPGTPFECLVFQPVPEPKVTKNRVHIDVDTHDRGALVAAGARVVRERDDGIGWTVLADPDGNEFCAFTD